MFPNPSKPIYLPFLWAGLYLIDKSLDATTLLPVTTPTVLWCAVVDRAQLEAFIRQEPLDMNYEGGLLHYGWEDTCWLFTFMGVSDHFEQLHSFALKWLVWTYAFVFEFTLFNGKKWQNLWATVYENKRFKGNSWWHLFQAQSQVTFSNLKYHRKENKKPPSLFFFVVATS